MGVLMKELDKVHKYLDAQLHDFEERLKNCKKAIEDNALSVKQQERFMETIGADEPEDHFASRVKQETIEKNREAEEQALHKLKEEGRQRAFLYKSLETQYDQILGLKKELLALDEQQYMLVRKEDILYQVENAVKEAVKEAKKAFAKEAKEAQKKTAVKEPKKETKNNTAANDDVKQAISEFARTVEDFVFMDPGRVLQELELLKNKLSI